MNTHTPPINPFITYNGILCRQVQGTFLTLSNFFHHNAFDFIVEIGTGQGGFSCFLNDKAKLLKAHFVTIDRFHYNRPDNFYYQNMNMMVGDVFNPVTFQAITKMIPDKKRTLILCDGGDRIKEFCEFAEYLKENDVIMVHDFCDNFDRFDADFRNKVWDSCEVTHKAIDHVAKGLYIAPYHPFYEQLEKVAWGCYVKYKK
jgi:23S rRNA U2552 (ribose-2'-O)-methylase RlmE/FtsJ